MVKTLMLTTGLLGALLFAPASFAQTVTPDGAVAGTNSAQQQQIEQGLQSGQLSTGEAGRLEKGESHIDAVESHDMKSGGTLTQSEQTQINTMQTNEQNRITKDDNNAIKGNPNSASSQRMQSDVQRNVNQQNRIEQGANSGSLTSRETGKLEGGQAKVTHKEARAARNGHVSKGEQASIQRSENHQSNRIHRKKTNNVTATPAATPAAAPAQ